MLKSHILTVLFLFLTSGSLLAQQGSTVAESVRIPGTQQLRLTSSIIPNQEYVLHINLPGSYKDSTKKFPVVFLLDSQWDFPLLSAIYGEQYYDGFIPEVITVGITWGGVDPKHDQLRARDFSPTSLGKPEELGNAPKFLSFIKNELTPFIESKYPVKKDDRTLIGSSFGGLFTLYALFNETKFFNRYILTSPATQWDNEFIYKVENEYAQKNKDLPVKLYMAVGDLEDVQSFKKFEAKLKSRNFPSLALQTKVLENTGHSGTKAIGYTQGLQWVFKRPALSLTSAQLKPMEGTYALGEEKIKVEADNGVLVVVAPGNNRMKFAAESPTEFYFPGMFLFLQFKKDKDKVAGFQLKQFGGETFAKKIE